MNDDITTVSGLAQTALVTDQTIRNHINRGTLIARKLDGKWVIDEASARVFLAQSRIHPPSQRQLEAVSLGIADETLKQRRRATKISARNGAESAPNGDDSLDVPPDALASPDAIVPPDASFSRKKAEADLTFKRVRARLEERKLQQLEGQLYEAEMVETAFHRLAGLACAMLRHYATAIPTLLEDHLPPDLEPAEAARIKAEVSLRAVALVERDIDVLAKQRVEPS